MAESADVYPNWRDLLVSLRQITRATELHSKRVEKRCGLTLPQVMLLRAIRELGDVTVKRLAVDISLSQATVTTILDRLEERGLVERLRSSRDRRIVNARLTRLGEEMLATAPPLFDAGFIARFEQLSAAQQAQLVAALHQLATMMTAPGEAG